jgi:REP-associated tyrosine transposase
VPEYPRHLATFDYVGAYAYFLTFCTFDRNRLFLTAESVAIVHEQILRVCVVHGFQIDAYCYMPDHLHLVVAAKDSDSDLKQFINGAKQSAAFYFKRTTQHRRAG